MMDAHEPTNNNPTAPITLRIADAVRVSGLSRTTLYELMKNGSLASVKVGGRRLINFESLMALLTEDQG